MPRTKQFVKEEVLDKAMKLFWEKGFHATSMEDLVTTLQINRASMYNTFGSKSKLFEQSLLNYKAINIQRVSDFLYYQVNVRKGLYLLLENLIAEANSSENSKGCFMVNTTTELANTSAAVDKILEDNKVAFETIFFNYLKYGIDNGQISPYKDIKAIATYLYMVQSGLQVISKINSEKEASFKLIETSLKVLD